MRHRRRSAQPCFLRICALAWAIGSLAAAWADERSEPPTIDAESVAAWADETFNAAFERGEFSGATVSVVRDGALLFARGYGQADFARPDAVDPTTTQFRIGSISKTFTATLIAMLLEEGRIASLDDPVNRYLKDYRLPDNDGVPITLHHLLTHTAGFEDRFFFIGADFPTPARPSAEEFDRLRPAYVRPAGSRIVYSNFGIALLGRVVEDVTGQSIERVMQERLFDPLGMQHSQLLVDIGEPEGIGKPAVIWPDGSKTARKFNPINPAIAPAGSIVSTAYDMAQYMLAHLGHGPTDPETAKPLLSRETLDRLHTRTVSNEPETTGIGMVFFDEDWGGVRTVAHGGNWPGFHSWMTLLPTLDTGIFVSVMAEAPPASVSDALGSLFMPWKQPPRSPAVTSGAVYANAFLTRFIGEKRALPDATESSDASKLAGWYRPDRRVFTTAESIADFVYMGAGILRVNSDPEGLEIGGAKWRAAGNGIFILDAPARNRAVIRHDPRVGAPVLVPDLGIYTFTRIAWYQHPRLHVYTFATALIVCVVGLVLARGARSRAGRIAAWVTTVAAWLLPCIALVGQSADADMLSRLYAGHTERLAAFVSVSNLIPIAALIALWGAVKRAESARDRLGLGLVGIAGLAIATVLYAYNVIGWKLPA
jgi:CubicO group peptidase (beta-lactamase class C family)